MFAWPLKTAVNCLVPFGPIVSARGKIVAVAVTLKGREFEIPRGTSPIGSPYSMNIWAVVRWSQFRSREANGGTPTPHVCQFCLPPRLVEPAPAMAASLGPCGGNAILSAGYK